MTRLGPGRAVGVLVAGLAVVLAGCAPLPATGPRLATGDGPGDRAGAGAGTTDGSAPQGPPDWVAPDTGPEWTPCADGRTPGVPDDARIDCALTGQTPTLRLTTPDTPSDAPPLVVVAGAESPADDLAVRLASAGTELTDSHPLVILDHRGRTGPAGTCLSVDARRTLDGLAAEGTDPTAPEVRSDLADATQSCTDQLQGQELHYSSAAAADDLEALRQAWQVPGLAILGMGTGARTALAYAGSHPGHVSLLALDSPAPLDGDQETAARAALGGSDAALRLWAASCTHDECGPGDPDEKVDAISRAIADARSDGAPVPAAMLSDVVRAALGDISGSSAPEPSEGDEILGSLVREGPDRTPAPVRSSATRLAASSLPFVAGCSDLSRRVPVDRVGQLSSEWADEQPFGPVLAAQVSACSTWPVPAPAPVELPGEAPVLLLSGIADPVAGAAPLEPTAAILTAAGAPEVRTVTWGAPGSRVVLHSACARSAVVEFMDDPAAGDGSAACPS